MPAEQISTVNLLEHETAEGSPIGRIVTWATTYGRYIMITTEIIVLLAFISRFSLDRKRADLDDAIESKQAIIEANKSFEAQFRQIQAELSRIKGLLDRQAKPLAILQTMKSVIPSDVYFETYDYTGTKLNIRASAGSTHGFMVFMNNLQGIKEFYRVEVGEIKKDPVGGITFQFSVYLEPEKPPKQIPAKTNTETESQSNL